MDPNSAGFPAMHHNSGYPVTSQSPLNQQVPYYPNAVPGYPQQKTPLQPQRAFGGVPLQPAGPGGAMMPSGFPQNSSGPHANFSAPFAQPPVQTTAGQFSSPQVTSTPNLPNTTTAPSLPPNMTSVSTNSASAAQQRPSHQPSASQGGTPTGPQSAREKARVTTLLDINSMLLQEVVNLQAAGKSGGPPQQQGSQDANSTGPDPSSEPPKSPAQKPSPEYIECMRRLQANLAYLAAIADRAKKSGNVPPAAPAIMTPPPNLPSMNEIYGKLNELFPRSTNPTSGTPQPSPQGLQGNGKPSPSPGAESAV